MKKPVRILIWQKGQYLLLSFFKNIDSSKAEVKGMDEFGFEAGLWSQTDFDRIIEVFEPDIVVLDNRCRNAACIDIPSHIYVCVNCDHICEIFSLIGKRYFDILHKNDFLYLPMLNADVIDTDHVLEDEIIRDKIITSPFVPFIPVGKNKASKSDNDISIITSLYNIDFFHWAFSIDETTASGRSLMQFLGELVPSVQNELYMQERLTLEDIWIEKEIVRLFDKFGIWQYARDKERLIKLWVRAVKYVIIPQENIFNIAIWVIETGYDLKLYGPEWCNHTIFKPYAMGTLPEASEELYTAYQNSKIIINTNTSLGIHRKTFEAIEFECLLMQADAGSETMVSNYAPYFKDGESIVVFRNKKELLDKIDHYLPDEKARERIIAEGKATVKNMKWDTVNVINDVFDQLIQKIEKTEEKSADWKM